MPDTVQRLIKRSDFLSFMKVGTAYERMTGFTQLAESKNATTYERQYVDKESKDTDVTGYAPSIAYSFDRHTNNPVHEAIALIHDMEKTGPDALVEIITVNKQATGETNARKRTFAVVPGGSGDGTDALVYTGTFNSKSDIVEVKATLSDDEQSITLS